MKDIVDVPVVKRTFLFGWAQYTTKTKSKEDRDKLQNFLEDNGIPSMIYYPKTLHCQKLFSSASDEVLSLPMHPYLKDVDVNKVVETIINYFDEISLKPKRNK